MPPRPREAEDHGFMLTDEQAKRMVQLGATPPSGRIICVLRPFGSSPTLVGNARPFLWAELALRPHNITSKVRIFSPSHHPLIAANWNGLQPLIMSCFLSRNLYGTVATDLKVLQINQLPEPMRTDLNRMIQEAQTAAEEQQTVAQQHINPMGFPFVPGYVPVLPYFSLDTIGSGGSGFASQPQPQQTQQQPPQPPPMMMLSQAPPIYPTPPFMYPTPSPTQPQFSTQVPVMTMLPGHTAPQPMHAYVQYSAGGSHLYLPNVYISGGAPVYVTPNPPPPEQQAQQQQGQQQRAAGVGQGAAGTSPTGTGTGTGAQLPQTPVRVPSSTNGGGHGGAAPSTAAAAAAAAEARRRRRIGFIGIDDDHIVEHI